MVNNQNDFNNKYSKETEITEIKIEDADFQGQLDIKGYPDLENLRLQEVDYIEKITLQNLINLQTVIIWGCGLQELVIENCPQIKTLNIRSNSLTNLIFLAFLENLEELETKGNPQLSEILKPYKGDWRAYQKDLWEIKQGNFPQLVKKFSDLKQSREELKKQIASLLKDKEKFSVTSKAINTKELVLNLGKEFKEKEEKINYLELRAQELTELSKIKKQKIIDAFVRLSPEKDLLQKLIEVHLEFTKAKKQKQPVIKLKRKKEKIYSELETKIGDEEIIEKVETILTDCEELVQQELELENKLDNKSDLIAEHKLQITNNQEIQDIVKKESEVHEQQVIQYKRQRSQSVIIEIAKLQGERNAYKELAILPRTNQGVIIQGDSNSVATNSNRAYHDSQHQEFNNNQFHQQVPPKK